MGTRIDKQINGTEQRTEIDAYKYGNLTDDKGALQSNEKRAVFVINGIRSVVYLYEEEMNLDPFFRFIKKTISRCVADLNVIM